MDKKSILIGALGASLLFVTLSVVINSNKQTISAKWQYYPSKDESVIGHLLNTETGSLYFVSGYKKRLIKDNDTND